MTTATYTDREVRVNGLKIHYQEWGDASLPAILMVHGFGVSGHMFDEFAEKVRDRYRLVAIDQRGHGDSDWAEDGDYSRDAFVRDLEGVCESLGLGRFFLMGHSMGGLNAAAFAARHPGLLKGLVLVDAGPEAAKEGVDNIMRFTSGPDELEFDEFVDMAHRFNPRRSIDNIRERMRHRLKPTESGKWTWKFDRRFRSDRDALSVGDNLSNDETWALFRSIQVPALIVRGAESDVLTQEVAERTAAEMPQAALAVVPGAGHSVPGDNPDDFAQVVTRFIDDVEAGRFTPANHSQPDAPIEELVHENEVMQRSRPGVGTLVALGAGAAIAAVGIGYTVRRARKKRSEKARRVRIEQIRQQLQVPDSVDLDAAQQRVAALATELAAVGKQSAERARQLASDVDVDAALAQARATAGEARQRSRAAVQSVDRRKLRKEGEEAARRTGSLAMAAFHAAMKLIMPPRKRRRRNRRLLPWRS